MKESAYVPFFFLAIITGLTVISAVSATDNDRRSLELAFDSSEAAVATRQNDYDDYYESRDESTEVAALTGKTNSVKQISWGPSDNGLEPALGQTSLVIVFDGTTSMFDDLQQLKMGAKAIIEEVNARERNPIFNYVFVPFRDPKVGPKLVTRNQTHFLQTIESLELFGGGDCPESTLKGIEMGLESSLPKSFVFVFTDAVASDFQFEASVLQLIQEKQASVTFLLTGFCDSKGEQGYKVYERIADASNGQVFDLKKRDIGQVLSVLRDFLNPHNVPLKAVKNPKGVNPPIELTVDSNLKMFSVSVSGTNPHISISNEQLHPPPEQNTSIGLEMANLQIVKVLNPQTGRWTVKTRSDSENAVRVMGISELILEFGFSLTPLEFFNSSSFTPTLGVKNILSVQPAEENLENFGDLKTVRISFAPTQSLIDFSLPLKYNKTSQLFVTDPFEPPRSPFQLSIQGHDKDGIEINRILSTEIKATIGSPPDVIFNEESQTIVTGSTLKMICQIRSFGVASSLILQNERIQDVLEIKFSEADPKITFEKVVDVLDSGLYSCSAKNEFGTRVKKMNLTVIEIPPPLTLLGVPIEGSEVALQCSPLTAENLLWTVNGNNVETVWSANSYMSGMSLILKDVRRAMSGNYSCIANSSSKLFVDVLYPVEKDAMQKEFILFDIGDSLTVNCGLIGNPRPDIYWETDKSFPTNEHNELVINPAEEAMDGMKVRCSGINQLSSEPMFNEILLKKKLTIEITQSPDPVSHGEDLHVNCHGPSNIRVSWIINGLAAETVGSGIKLTGSQMTVHNVGHGDEIFLECHARTNYGILKETKRINVKRPVLPSSQPPKIDRKSIPEYYLLDESADEMTIECTAKGDPLPRVYWTYHGRILRDSPKLRLGYSMEEGEYNCVAENNAGKDTQWLVIERRSIPTSVLEEVVNLREGDHLNYTCPILTRTQQNTEILWTKNDQINYSGDHLLIIHASPMDSGKYSCCPKRSSYCASVTIVVKPKRRKIEAVNRYVEFEPGQELRIPCEGHLKPNATFEWTKNGVGQEQSSRVLLLKGTREYEGDYSCLSSDDLQEYQVNYKVVFKQLPKITFMSNLTLENTLNCEAIGHPLPILAWLHEGTKIVSTTLAQFGVKNVVQSLEEGKSIGIGLDGRGFEIPSESSLRRLRHEPFGILRQFEEKVSFQWTVQGNKTGGTWTCVALNKWGAVNRSLTIPETEKAPELLAGEVEEENHAVSEGLPLILECHVGALPGIQIGWKKDNIPVKVDYRISLENRNNVLIIVDTSVEDSGTYECTTWNLMGKTKKSHHVLVHPKKPSTDPQDYIYQISVLRGQRTVLHCPIDGDELSWSKLHFSPDRIPLPTKILHETKNLTVLTTEPVEFYQCSSSSSFGRHHALFQVTTEHRPIIKNINSVTLSPKLFSSILLPCWTDGEPRPNITWYRNTKILTANLRVRLSAHEQVVRISNIRGEDNGVYSCIAKNYLGSSSKTFSVQVVQPTILSPWSRWSNCSESCGLGTRSRSRECLFWNGETAATNNTPQCAGEKLETEECLVTECPVDGVWSEWTNWSPCSISCKSSSLKESSPSIRFRHRDCSNPAPAFGGVSCKGLSYQQEICDVPFCPIDGGWSEFSNYSACSASCGGGMRIRSRICNNPMAQFNGRECSGESFEVQHCNEGNCFEMMTAAVAKVETWSAWSDWNECTALCGSGLKSRTRKCLHADGDCQGENIEFQQCDGNRCEARFQEETYKWYYNAEHAQKLQASAMITSSSSEEESAEDVTVEKITGTYPTTKSFFNPRVSITLESSIPLTDDISKIHFEAGIPTVNKSCELGFEYRDGFCDDINECLLEHVCSPSQLCVNTRGGFACECDTGYEMFAQICVDIDECARRLHDCSHGCVNTPGSYYCDCPEGFQLTDDFQTCAEELAKLELRNAPQDDPVYFVDSDHCPEGSSAVNGKCVDVDECATLEENCATDQRCLNTRGGYVCIPIGCPEHFVEQEDAPGTCYESCGNETIHTCANDAKVGNRIVQVVLTLDNFAAETPIHKLVGYDATTRRALEHTDFHLQYNPSSNNIFHLKQWRQGIAYVFAREMETERIYKLVAFGRTIEPDTRELLYLHKFIIYLYR